MEGAIRRELFGIGEIEAAEGGGEGEEKAAATTLGLEMYDSLQDR